MAAAPPPRTVAPNFISLGANFCMPVQPKRPNPPPIPCTRTDALDAVRSSVRAHLRPCCIHDSGHIAVFVQVHLTPALILLQIAMSLRNARLPNPSSSARSASPRDPATSDSAAIKESVNKGAVLVNYIGHGGETGWAHEQILTVPTIQNWTNYNRMPVFMTATCEFSRFDDHDRVSAGEYTNTAEILSPHIFLSLSTKYLIV